MVFLKFCVLLPFGLCVLLSIGEEAKFGDPMDPRLPIPPPVDLWLTFCSGSRPEVRGLNWLDVCGMEEFTKSPELKLGIPHCIHSQDILLLSKQS